MGTFTFANWAGPAIPVHYYRPATVTATTPVLLVFHGTSRTAGSYRDAWVDAATAGHYIVLAPEFSEQDFPESLAYQEGHVLDAAGQLRPREQWSFAAIEPLFDAVRTATGTQVSRYAMYGHSGGAQFVHRFLMLMPEARYSRAIAANAGWYTLPQMSRAYPVGLGATPVTRDDLAAALRKRLIILLGTEDTDPNDPTLPTSSVAMEQGPNRLERGRYFFARAQEAAADQSVSLVWRIEYVQGVGHDNRGMVAAAKDLVWN
ncbi:hypothetical protein K3172_04475 [Qipengyuania sp. 6B39]|uniref:alpha/beta hydrolase family protein n=1 Tax=Qipengyuania proteolytica TaxID=2867239 RepID=UPI001C8A80C6|nr:hypothetical protein [Qipengyuania proteolytica]MBX7495111.1 hypothetical protein [Qipengyuania proteolytica]